MSLRAEPRRLPKELLISACAIFEAGVESKYEPVAEAGNLLLEAWVRQAPEEA